jgi:predicted enzyme related to lactoylglutathione lyase
MTNDEKARLAYVNILAVDIVALSEFYARVFGFPEIEAHRSPIYRCLDAGAVELGFNAPQAYDLLAIGNRRPTGPAPVKAYLTMEVSSPAAVDACVAAATGHGGRVLKAPYTTYYNAIQAVLEDPEGNVFRVNHRMGPRKPADEVENPPWAARSDTR